MRNKVVLENLTIYKAEIENHFEASIITLRLEPDPTTHEDGTHKVKKMLLGTLYSQTKKNS